MHNMVIRFLTTFMIMALISTCSKDRSIVDQSPQNNSGKYINGNYQGQTVVDHEGYHALASVQIVQNCIAVADWQIYDNNSKRFFDETYEEVYKGIPLYQQQCRDNMAGMVTFGPRLIETQDLNAVDNITGATWCYKKFKEVMEITLKDAYRDTTGHKEK